MKEIKTLENKLTLSEKEYNKLKVLLNNIEIREINDDTIVISSDKNIVIHSSNNIVNIAENVIVNKAQIIHLNPVLSIKKLMDRIFFKKSLKEIK